MDRALRLISANPVDELARTVEALLVIAASPLTVAELAAAAEDDVERVEAAPEVLCEQYREGKSGIVLEYVAGGWAYRASAEAAAACARLVERPTERGLSQAAFETLAVVAYLGPCSRPEIARARRQSTASSPGWSSGAGPRGGVRPSSAPCATARRSSSNASWLESLSELPRVDDLGDDVTEIARGSKQWPKSARPDSSV